MQLHDALQTVQSEKIDSLRARLGEHEPRQESDTPMEELKRLTKRQHPPKVEMLVSMIVDEQLQVDRDIPCNRPFTGTYGREQLRGLLEPAGKVRGVRGVHGIQGVTHGIHGVQCEVCGAIRGVRCG